MSVCPTERYPSREPAVVPGRAAMSRKLGALSVAVLWLGSTTWHAMHQRTASLPPTEGSCAAAGNASSAKANDIVRVLRICFSLRRRSLMASIATACTLSPRMVLLLVGDFTPAVHGGR